MKNIMQFPKVAMNNGVFPVNIKGHTYKPVPYHGSSTHGTRGGRKTRWTIPQNGQYYVFNYADERNWMDLKARGLFSFLNKCYTALGENGERLAFFPQPTNMSDPWHGYPVFSDEIEDVSLVERWAEENEIDVTIMQRLLRQAI